VYVVEFWFATAGLLPASVLIRRASTSLTWKFNTLPPVFVIVARSHQHMLMLCFILLRFISAAGGGGCGETCKLNDYRSAHTSFITADNLCGLLKSWRKQNMELVCPLCPSPRRVRFEKGCLKFYVGHRHPMSSLIPGITLWLTGSKKFNYAVLYWKQIDYLLWPAFCLSL